MKVVKRVGQGRRVSKNKYHSAQVEDGVLLEDLGSNLFQIINEEVHCTRHTTFAPEPRQQSNWLFHRYSLSNILAVWITIDDDCLIWSLRKKRKKREMKKEEIWLTAEGRSTAALAPIKPTFHLLSPFPFTNLAPVHTCNRTYAHISEDAWRGA